jgi:hypothetical protein
MKFAMFVSLIVATKRSETGAGVRVKVGEG